ncbi:MAG: sugar phosphate isomerase/epimerase [Victivallales bacterium]|nr:sugar phosphate isomerase/epimerase [Victivallales bacterium]
MIAINSSFHSVLASPDDVLAAIAHAGFEGVWWSQMGKGDFHYLPEERKAIARSFRKYGLRAASVHAAEPFRRLYYSENPWHRKAGVELLLNRMELASELECPVVVFHAPSPFPRRSDAIFDGLDETLHRGERFGVLLAVENGETEEVLPILQRYSPRLIGFAYDSGHAFCQRNAESLHRLCFNRLVTVHLHDNDGLHDQHKIPFTGFIGWNTEAVKLAEAGWKSGALLEVSEKCHKVSSHEAFLRQAHGQGMKLERLLGNAIASRRTVQNGNDVNTCQQS